MATPIDSRTYYPTLVNWSFRREQDSKFMLGILLILAGTALLTISSKIPIAITPVPFTLQTLVLLIMGMIYGARIAALTVLVYLFEGALGLPVFEGTPEKGVGLSYMMGPDGGYLVGFLLAATTVGYLAERGWDRTAWGTGAAMVIGMVLVYVPGLAWIMHTQGWNHPIMTTQLASILWSELAKVCVAAIALPMMWRATSWPKFHMYDLNRR